MRGRSRCALILLILLILLTLLSAFTELALTNKPAQHDTQR